MDLIFCLLKYQGCISFEEEQNVVIHLGHAGSMGGYIFKNICIALFCVLGQNILYFFSFFYPNMLRIQWLSTVNIKTFQCGLTRNCNVQTNEMVFHWGHHLQQQKFRSPSIYSEAATDWTIFVAYLDFLEVQCKLISKVLAADLKHTRLIYYDVTAN